MEPDATNWIKGVAVGEIPVAMSYELDVEGDANVVIGVTAIVVGVVGVNTVDHSIIRVIV